MSESPTRSNEKDGPEESAFVYPHPEDDHEHGSQHDETTRDYSTRMEELFADEEHHPDEANDSDNEEGFLYSGIDASVSIGYHDRLRDVLGPDHDDEEEDDTDAHEVERSLIIDDHEKEHSDDDEPLSHEISSQDAMSVSSGFESPKLNHSLLVSESSGLARPFLHPTVSRLRSYTPQGSPVPSTTSNIFPGTSSPSHFSSISRMSSISNLRSTTSDSIEGKLKQPETDVFQWTELRNITHHIYSSYSTKASSVLGAASGSPTVLSANGFICIGTDDGKICVYDFRQTLKCICTNAAEKNVGAVTALALSHDHTYVASGHSTGYIQLYDLKAPHTPTRVVPPTTLTIVASGRKEGHIQGSRIVSIGFIATRHTALVSADENGLSFYHSLGKVLFVEAPDILRILGKYPLDGSTLLNKPKSANPAPSRAQKKTRYTVLSMMPLPLGTSSHPTDGYNIIALLTPSKLVVVGLKPTPKTWFKCARKAEDTDASEAILQSRWRGTLCWFPSKDFISGATGEAKPANGPPPVSNPLLAYSWGRMLKVIRVIESKVKQTVRNPKTGKISGMEVGTIGYEDVGKIIFDEDLLALQWHNVNQIVVLSTSALQVYDLSLSKIIENIGFDGLSLVSPSLKMTVSGASYSRSVGDVSHSMRAYKGKIFLLGRQSVQVGTLLIWADKILALVQEGDFLGAIEITRSYYLGTSTGNTNGLPEDPGQRKEVVGKKMRELMIASTRYAFSEDRMTDGTHLTPDGRGVDRTSLFENLVGTCCRACITLDDYEFLFEDLFQHYDDWGITRIFLIQLETFVLDNEIRYVPPRITQRLIAMHDEDNLPKRVERIIWHIDAECLDINQAISLCQSHHLYDALIYVYTRALRDYVAPVVELLGLIRRIYQLRRSRSDFARHDAELEPLVLNAYKIYPYLADVLQGLTYPSEEPLPEEDAIQAKKDVYSFLFFGRSSIWPPGEGGKLVLTAEEEGGVEPTFPYVRQLLRFDSESFLHSLDIAFEDTYFNNESQDIIVSRLVIVRVLLEILSIGVSSVDATFINIFLARNIAKYSYSLQNHIPPSSLHAILVGLAEDPDRSTREDRQLAAEFLLSVYNPHDSEGILQLFKDAGFYRILRSWYRRDGKWLPLVSTYLEDSSLSSYDAFSSIDETLTTAGSHADIIAFIEDSIPSLLKSSVANTASLLDKYAPTSHARAVEILGKTSDEDRLCYLRQLLSSAEEHDEYLHPIHGRYPSDKVDGSLCELYVSLQCRFAPNDVIQTLQHLPRGIPDWERVVATCENAEVFDAAMWALNSQGRPLDALSKAEVFNKRLTLKLVDVFSGEDTTNPVEPVVEKLKKIDQTGIFICLENCRSTSEPEVPLEDIWFRLLNSQITCVQTVSSCCSAEVLSAQSENVFIDEHMQTQWRSLASLRSLIQETFSALVSVSSARAVSFPRLFSRLVNSATQSQSTHTHYNEFRSILTSMLESYRSDGDMLTITKHLLDRDVFDTMAKAARQQVRGWAPSRQDCMYCRKPIFVGIPKTPALPSEERAERVQFVISRTGSIYHTRCSPQGS